jgi:uncharacterized protein YjbJ (UPF0337 family)
LRRRSVGRNGAPQHKEASIMAGIGDKVVGKAEELKGKVTGNRTEEAKGKARQAKGTVKDKVNRATVHAQDAFDRSTRNP